MSVSDPRTRRLVRNAAGALATIAGGWMALLVVTGGFDTTVLGVPLTAHEPLRPLLISSIALTLYMLAGGDARATSVAVNWARASLRAAIRIESVWEQAVSPDRRWHAAHVLAILMGAALATAATTYGSKAGGGADSYGYVSEAELFLHGRLTDPQPWARDVPWPNAVATFAPLGYRPGPENWLLTPPVPHAPRDEWSITPTYAQGLPLLMALFKWIGGQPGVFFVSPLSGALLVFATFAIGRRLGVPLAGLLGAWLVGTSPNVLEMTLAPMSDVPVAAAWACTYWGLLGRSMRSGVGAAIAGGLAILIRPNLFFMAAPVFMLILQQIWTASRSERRSRILRGILVMAGLGAGIAGAASLNWAINGSPFMSGYGTLREVLNWSNVGPNIRNYPRWFVEAQTPVAVLGFVALFIPLASFWPGVRHRSTIWCLAAFVAGVWIEYFYWGAFETRLYLRFLLSTWPFIMIGLATVVLTPARFGPVLARRLTMTAGIIFLASLGLRSLLGAQARGVFLQRVGESKYVTTALAIRDVTPDTAVIFSMQHSGSVRYYAGRMTIRYDQMPSDWMIRSLSFLTSQGAHPYLLIEEWEREQFVDRFAAEDSVVAFTKRPPLLTYRQISLYDLAPAPGPAPVTLQIPDEAANLSIVPPAPAPGLVIRK